MRVKLLTFHRAHNFGAALQAFGLKSYVESLGHDVSFVDFWNQNHQGDYSLIPKYKRSTPWTLLKSLLVLAIKFYPILARRRRFKRFQYKQLKLTNEMYSDRNLMSQEDADIILLGSDQIWRKHNYDSSPSFEWEYFGSCFPNSIKLISYAASMGTINIDSSDIPKLRLHLSRISRVLVREKSLAASLKKDINVNASVVLDPCFLLPKEVWSSMLKEDESSKRSYILMYNLRGSIAVERFARKLAKSLGINLIEIKGNVNSFSLSGLKEQCSGPIEFLRLIKGAEYVVSSSFHGVVFSIIFQKSFFAGGMAPNKERVTDLLTALEIQNRYSEDLTNSLELEKIDYYKVNRKLQALINKSQQCLISSLRDDNLLYNE